MIAQFYELQPEIEINIYEEVLGGAGEAISSGRADLVIGAGAKSTPGQNIKYRTIQQIEWVFAAAPGHALTTAPLPLSRELIEQHRFVVVRDSSRNQAPQSRRLFSKRPVLSVPSMNEKISALSSGLGVGFLPAHRIQAFIDQGLPACFQAKKQVHQAPVFHQKLYSAFILIEFDRQLIPY